MLYFEEWKVLGASQPNVLYKEEINSEMWQVIKLVGSCSRL